MAFNETLSNRIREALANLPHVTEKRMFGGVCYMVNNKMCMGVVGDDLMCRIGEDAYEAALERPGCREMTFTGKPMRGYVFVSEDGFRTSFREWVDLCLAFNPKAKASRK